MRSVRSLSQLVVIDLLVLWVIFLIPGISHLTKVPFYYLEPMRFLLLLSIFFTMSKPNTLLLGILIPVFSWVVSGHPLFIKALLICAELLINGYLMMLFLDKRWNLIPALTFSIVISKVFYYLLKYLAVLTGVLPMEIISTDLRIQCISILIITIILFILFRKKTFNRNV
ncbi:MAG: hypothetical protein WCI71_12510 [Bacteroidota bacterium]